MSLYNNTTTDAVSSVFLLEGETNLIYELKMEGGKLTLEEVVSAPATMSLLRLSDNSTDKTYAIKVLSGKLVAEAEGAVSDIKYVLLSDYWMPVLRNLREFKEIAKAEEPEFIYLLSACNRALENLFIETADEYGISRFEEMMGIYPESGATLDTRRFSVQSRWVGETYNLEALKRQLHTLCGNDGYSLLLDNNNYRVEVKLSMENEKHISRIAELLDRVMPANLVKTVTIFNSHDTISTLTHEYLSYYTHEGIRGKDF